MNKQDEILDLCGTLENVSYQIAELARIKEELEARLNGLIEHPEEGSKSYIEGKYKITISTGFNYTLDKDEYEQVGSRLASCFNPVKMKTTFELDKKIIRDCEAYGSKEDVLLMSQIIHKKPKKLHMKINAAC